MTLTSLTPDVSYDPTQDVHLQHYGLAEQLGRGTWLVLRQNLLVELEEFSAVVPMCALGLLVVLVMSLVVESGSPSQLSLAAGVLWGGMFLAGPVGLERQNSGPDVHATMTYLLLSPLPRASIYLGKWLFHCLLMFCTSGVSLIAVAAFLDAPVGQVWILVSVILGGMGFSAAGVVVSALTAAMKKNQGLLAVVALPLSLPLFLIGMSLCRTVWSGAPWQSFQHWLYLILLYNGLSLLGGIWATEHVWREWQ